MTKEHITQALQNHVEKESGIASSAASVRLEKNANIPNDPK